tara:strand:+ start:813 stop:1184 length:372 start_codon:yes stop_codon:yes gene_type:complete
MLLPGENYSEQLMFTVEAYKEEWVERRAATLYGEVIENLSKASDISTADKKQIENLKSNVDIPDYLEHAIDVADAARKGFRFSKVAAPLILADGPLPIGDVIFAIALGIDFGIAAYNLVSRDE